MSEDISEEVKNLISLYVSSQFQNKENLFDEKENITLFINFLQNSEKLFSFSFWKHFTPWGSLTELNNHTRINVNELVLRMTKTFF